MADALGWALHRAGKSEEALEYARQAVDTGVRNASYAYHRAMIERELAQYGPARRHLEEALRTNPAFSPLGAPKAREALETLGEPPPGGPGDMQPPPPPPAPSQEPKREARPEAKQEPEREPKPEPKRESPEPEAPAPAPSQSAPAPSKAAPSSPAAVEADASKSP